MFVLSGLTGGNVRRDANMLVQTLRYLGYSSARLTVYSLGYTFLVLQEGTCDKTPFALSARYVFPFLLLTLALLPYNPSPPAPSSSLSSRKDPVPRGLGNEPLAP
jgi:hypothetical protein